ncbi:hypothetical protein CBOM_05306 [Ceraceosorus bombacis]|uniref:Uncharacterized protein n=1 Tax=Ceraceosorus bombacis TaxID=401625 RepID=A0A0P1BQI3_9BASI|nr:hypothetical protein CBOM_05306 [Ceraceosorus bombacis]
MAGDGVGSKAADADALTGGEDGVESVAQSQSHSHSSKDSKSRSTDSEDRASFESRMARLPVKAALPLRRTSSVASSATPSTRSGANPVALATNSSVRPRIWGTSPPSDSSQARSKYEEEAESAEWKRAYGNRLLESPGDWKGHAKPIAPRRTPSNVPIAPSSPASSSKSILAGSATSERRALSSAASPTSTQT